MSTPETKAVPRLCMRRPGKVWMRGAKTLLKHGADPNLPDNTGRTPLHLAYAAERQDMVNRLLEAGANLEARDQEGRVPIQHLPTDDPRGEHEQEQRANDSNEIRNMDNLPHSLRTGPEGYERIQNALNPADSEGRTPLHRAAENESVLGVRKLLQAGADPNTVDREGVHAVAPGSPIRFARNGELSARGQGRSQRGRQGRCHAVALCGQ